MINKVLNLMHAGPIWIDNLDCSRSHDILSECEHNGWGVHNCDHSEDIGVICWPGLIMFMPQVNFKRY